MTATTTTPRRRPRPAHKAHPVASVVTGRPVAWTINQGQLPAIRRAFTRTILIHCAPCGDLEFVQRWADQLAAGLITTIGLNEPASRPPLTPPRE